MLREKARATFEQYNTYPGRALENHNLRLARFTLLLSEVHGITLDEDLVHAACYLHDIGLLVHDADEPLYLRRSWNLVAPLAQHWGLEGESLQALREILLYNHTVSASEELLPMAQLLRAAVQVEHSLGTLLHGLTRDAYQAVVADLPRLDLTTILFDFARITYLEDGSQFLLPMFFPRFDGEKT